MEHQDHYSLIINALNHPADAALQAQLAAWRGLDVANEAEYTSIKRIWEQSANVEERYTGRDLDQAVAAFTARLEEKIQYNSPAKTYKLWWRAAAAVLVFGMAGLWGYRELKSEAFIFRSTNDQQDSILLVDGSKVFLNKHTQIKYATTFSKSQRKFFLLKGEAFFDIAKDPAHPFTVLINKSAVQVLGTTFNIQNIDSTIALEVKSGKVMFESTDRDPGHILEKGMAIRYDQKTGKTQKYLGLNTQTNSNWLYKELNFVDATLPEVCALIEQQYGVKITIQGNISNIKKLNANFKNDPLKDVLDVLRMTYKITIDHHDNQIIIKQ
ncbi:FecR domain-containing protein [Pedobacter sp. N36a]|uniref:FecR family protein n=1 Tax=Pedobacter sp. N36a TaxID=2767996 RepID=UPI0016573BBF|nr:FecR family protein [Pedobacter sp. N36a]MBC8987108.1 FecR domain-containing protein [Pedobacter sp. N36a]